MSQQKRECWNTTFETALTVLERGWATIDQLRSANAWRLNQAPRIGKLALLKGKITMAQVFAVLGEQGIRGKKFGETAVELGFLNQEEVYELLLDQADNTPGLLDSLVACCVITQEQAGLVSKEADLALANETTAVVLVEAA